MKTIQLIVLVVFMFSALHADCQTKKPSISFDKTDHNFGTIKEEDGVVSVTFTFTNTGGEPLILGRVKASCGCTTPSWTKEPIPPGAKGEVKAAYNPLHRPGRFNKSITVNSNAENPTQVLHISGEVTPKPKTLEDDYKIKMGDLRLKSNRIVFANINNTETQSRSLQIVNISDKPITVDFEKVPKHMSISCTPKELNPKQKGEINVTYNAAEKNDWDYVSDDIYIKVNGEYDGKNRLYVTATISEDFSKYSPEDFENAPIAHFENKNFEFEAITEGDKVEHKYVLKNNGKSDLLIRKIKASCGCTATQAESEEIKPGESTTINTVFNSRGKRGRQNKTITVITNDPKNPKIVLWIKGMVNEKEQ